MSTPTSNIDPSLRAVIDGLVSSGDFAGAAKFAKAVLGDSPEARLAAAFPGVPPAASAPLKGAALVAAARAEGRLLSFGELKAMSLPEMQAATETREGSDFVKRSVAALRRA